MFTLFILILCAALFRNTSFLNASSDAQTIIFAISIASDLNLLLGGLRRK